MKRTLTSLFTVSLLSTMEGISCGTRALSTHTKRGAFILFEGVDRCGKTTQVGMLKEHLAKSKDVEQIRFPERKSAVGQLIDSYLQSNSNLNDQSIHLLFSANRWEQSDSIEEKLSNGCNLVCDRYAYSGVAFTSAKGLDLDWCKSCDRGLPAPDCVIYLDIPVEDAAKRGNFGEERYEKIDFQKKVREQFMMLKNEDETTGSLDWHIVDARQSIDEIHNQIASIVENVVASIGEKPIQKLWIK